jgi:iron(III) transport system substrate-binding protein
VLPFRSLAALATVAFVGSLPAVADAQLNVICSTYAELCRLLVDEFQKETGIKAMVVSTPSGGVALATLAEQKGRPQSDVWLGGAARAHYRAEKFGLVDEYASPLVSELQPWAQKVAEQSKSQSFGIYARVLGIGYNSALATQKKLAAPACWKDLVKPGYAGEVHISDPNQSRASYLAMTDMSQIFGEDQALAYLKTMYKVSPTTKKGRAEGDANGAKPPSGSPQSSVRIIGKGGAGKAAAGDTAGGAPPVGDAIAGIGFVGDVVAEAEGGAPVKAVTPCEGTVYEAGAVSIVKGARNLDNAKKFVDWVLGAKAQELVVKASRAYPANSAVASSPLAPKWSDIKFIDYDIAKYEKSPMRKKLTERWTAEVGASAH